jgi:hypothetical protein
MDFSPFIIVPLLFLELFYSKDLMPFGVLVDVDLESFSLDNIEWIIFHNQEYPDLEFRKT